MIDYRTEAIMHHSVLQQERERHTLMMKKHTEQMLQQEAAYERLMIDMKYTYTQSLNRISV